MVPNIPKKPDPSNNLNDLLTRGFWRVVAVGRENPYINVPQILET